MIDTSNAMVTDFVLLNNSSGYNSNEIDVNRIQLQNYSEVQLNLIVDKLIRSFSLDESFRLSTDNNKVNIHDAFSEITHGDACIEIGKTWLQMLNPEANSCIVVRIKDLVIEDELCNGVILAMPPVDDTFLGNNFHENSDYSFSNGFLLQKLIIGVFVIEVYPEDGYRMFFKNNIAKGAAFSLLRNELLKAEPVGDEFHKTKAYLQMCNSFIKDQLPELQSGNKIEQADVMNKSISYFKKEAVFDEGNFLDEVFENQETAEAFRSYKTSYMTENLTDLNDSFDISPAAVQKSMRVFKSVIKLDRNFHIYVHGDKSLINKGVDESGKKFYKIYFNEEY